MCYEKKCEIWVSYPHLVAIATGKNGRYGMSLYSCILSSNAYFVMKFSQWLLHKLMNATYQNQAIKLKKWQYGGLFLKTLRKNVNFCHTISIKMDYKNHQNQYFAFILLDCIPIGIMNKHWKFEDKILFWTWDIIVTIM